jgi:hypothetical protein
MPIAALPHDPIIVQYGSRRRQLAARVFATLFVRLLPAVVLVEGLLIGLNYGWDVGRFATTSCLLSSKKSINLDCVQQAFLVGGLQTLLFWFFTIAAATLVYRFFYDCLCKLIDDTSHILRSFVKRNIGMISAMVGSLGAVLVVFGDVYHGTNVMMDSAQWLAQVASFVPGF